MAQSWEIDRKNQDLLTATRREMVSRALLGPEIQNSPFPLCRSISRLVGIVAWRFPSVRASNEGLPRPRVARARGIARSPVLYLRAIPFPQY